MRNVIVPFVLLLVPTASAQLVVDNTLSPGTFVLTQLGGPGVVTSNVTWSGDTSQFAGFDGTACNIGLAHGLMIATGNANVAVGPNSSGSATLGGGFYGSSDMDLVNLTGNGQSINDAASMEFDVVPTGDSLRITFVFASEEYLEFVNSINDVMGVLLSGPGINGPYMNNAINMALVPGNSSQAVSINNINTTTNPDLYIDNGTGYNAPYNADAQYVQFDGFTVPLTFTWPIQSGMTYHVKVAIGDAADTAYDSAVFLATGSLTAQSLAVSGIADRAATSPLRVSPNPGKGVVEIRGLTTSGNTLLVLLDAQGVLVRSRSVKGPSSTLDLEGVTSGLYLLRVTDAQGGVRTERLVVER